MTLLRGGCKQLTSPCRVYPTSPTQRFSWKVLMLNNCHHDLVDVTFEMLKTLDGSEYGGDTPQYHYCCRKCLKIISHKNALTQQTRKGEVL